MSCARRRIGRGSGRLGLLLGLACAAAAAQPAAAPASSLVIAASSGAPLPRGATAVARIGNLRFAAVPVPGGLGARAAARRLRSRPGVLAVEANDPVRRSTVSGTCVDAPAAPRADVPNLVAARGRPLPPTTPPIAVLDTGVDPAAPELRGRVLAGSDAVPPPPGGLADDDGHGTQVAAAAAGAGLVEGVSPSSPIIPIRIATATALATPATIIKGLELAAARRARVAVVAFSRPLVQVAADAPTTTQLAVNAAYQAGVITVVPVGNEGADQRVYPGGLAHVITVGSAGPYGVRDRFSNLGPWVDLVAPGAGLVLPAPRAVCPTGYASAEGTSFSAAEVAGAAALLAARRPSLTTDRLFDLVRRGAATDVGPQGFDPDSGFGLLSVSTGLGAPTPADDPHEVNDNVYWLRRDPRRHPVYLRRTARLATHGSVSPGKDPQDAFPIALRRGDVVRASVTNPDANAALYVSVWSTRTGPFDMRLPASRVEVARAGFTQNPAISYRARRSGTHYVAVFAPDRVIPGETQNIALAPPHTRYRLTLTRRCSSTRTLRVPYRRLRRPGFAIARLTVYDNGIRRARRTRTGLARRITLRGLPRGRHRIVFRATFGRHAAVRAAVRRTTSCRLRLSR